MVRFWVAASLVMFAAPAGASSLPGPYTGTVLRVIDGDSLEARVTIWLGQEVVTVVRLAGIDTPELRGGCTSSRARAADARDFLIARLAAPITLTDIETDKYGGRVVARVRDASGQDLSTALLDAGLAQPFSGGRKPSCAGE